MPRADRGEVWIVDLGLAAKVRPCLIMSVPTDPQDRVLVTLVPLTSSVQGTRFEVVATARFLKGKGVFDAQQIITVPQAKLVRKLGVLSADQLALVEQAVLMASSVTDLHYRLVPAGAGRRATQSLNHAHQLK